MHRRASVVAISQTARLSRVIAIVNLFGQDGFHPADTNNLQVLGQLIHFIMREHLPSDLWIGHRAAPREPRLALLHRIHHGLFAQHLVGNAVRGRIIFGCGKS